MLTSFLLISLLPFLAQENAGFADRGITYRLQASDVVEVDYTYTPEYDASVPVQPDGFVTLKMVGPVKIGGLTLAEATKSITEAANARFHHPEVTLQLKEYVKPHFVVAGEVEHPGVYDLRGSVTLIQAIAMSGGFKESSRQSQVVLVRRVSAGMAETRLVDAKGLIDPRNIHEDPMLRPDDMLIVPKNRLGKIEPYVRIAALGLTSLYGVSLLK